MTMGSVRRSTEWMCAIGLAVALGACGGDKGSAPPPRVPARLVVVSGIDQEIPVTAAAAAPVVARVETADGRPVPGVTVTVKSVVPPAIIEAGVAAPVAESGAELELTVNVMLVDPVRLWASVIVTASVLLPAAVPTATVAK